MTPRTAELVYEVVDVFAPRPFAGNPLAVVLDAGELRTEQCQALAREFHLSETTFVSEVRDGGYRVRIFTTDPELPFAGHPSVGTAHPLVRLGLLPAALERAAPDPRALAALLPDVLGGVSLLARGPGTEHTVRVFAGGLGWEEDPATGSAAMGTGVWLAGEGLVGEGTSAYRLHQGAALHRPSVLDGTVTVVDGHAVEATVAGTVHPVARGTIVVPA